MMFGVSIAAAQPPIRERPAPGGFRPVPGGPRLPGGGFNQGQIVNVNQQTGMMTLRTGVGNAAREQQFRMAADARFIGADRRPIKDGLKFNGFSNGTNVWFRSGTGNMANSISDMRLFDPSSPIMKGQASNGQIVNVDSKAGTVTIRTGSGGNVREQTFNVRQETNFFGPDSLALTDGLGFNGFRTGVPVWFQAGTGELNTTLSGLSLVDPAGVSAGKGPGDDNTPAAGGGSAGSGTGQFARGVIVTNNPESGGLSLRMGDGANEREVNMKVTPDTGAVAPSH